MRMMAKALNQVSDPCAASFVEALMAHRSDAELAKIKRYFKAGAGEYGEGDVFVGVRMGTVFQLAKTFIDLPPEDIEILMDSDVHEVRAGAMSIMAKQFAKKSTTAERREALYALYLCRHDRINNWDLVDLAAWHVLGAYLVDKPRDILYRLVVSQSLWERRSAILATFAFIRAGQFDDTLALASRLLDDKQDLIHKATGGMLRALGTRDRQVLVSYLDAHGRRMPATMLRYATEHFSADDKARYRL